MLWNELLTQGRIDLKRARKLHDEADYGFSAYSCQQALEKYLKAYLLKYDVLDRPSAISHADMLKLFKIIDDRVNEFSRKYSRLIQVIVPEDKLSDAKKKLGELLEMMQPNPRTSYNDRMKIKIQLWKYSLGEPVESWCESLFKIKREQLQESLKPIAKNFQMYYKKNIVPELEKISAEQKKIAAKRYAAEGGQFSKFMTQLIGGVIPELSIEEFNLSMIAMLTFMANGQKKSGYHKSAKIWEDRMKIYLIVYPYNFYNSIIKTYPHEDIGRYPTPIDGVSSLEQYTKYAQSLSALISEVELDCAKIENAINGVWEKA